MPRSSAPAPFSFLIAIRHPATVADVAAQQAALADLFQSIDAQTDRRFDVCIGCNPEQVLPPHPDYVRRAHVDLPPGRPLSEVGNQDELERLIRDDKGRRMRAAIDLTAPGALVMPTDDDDLVSRRIVEFALSRTAQVGWYVDLGYAWAPRGEVLWPMHGFHRLCGTSLVVPREWFRHVRGEGTEAEAIQELGSHRLIVDEAEAAGRLFRPLPFRGAIYRRGHRNASQVEVERIEAAQQAAMPLGERLAEAARAVRRTVWPERRGPTSAPRIFWNRPVTLTAAHRAEFFGRPEEAGAKSRARPEAALASRG